MSVDRFRGDPATSPGAAFARNFEPGDEPPVGAFVTLEWNLETGIKAAKHGLGYVPSWWSIGPTSNVTVRYAVGDAEATRAAGYDPREDVIVTASGTNIGRVKVWLF